MLNRNNEHFENMRKIGEAYETVRRAHEEKKEEILEKYGWESEELKAWYEKKKEMTYPIPAEACKAYRAWMQTIEREEDEVAMDDFLWDREVSDFIDALRKAGIESFIYTNSSTAAMENMHAFEDEGCRLEGLCKITRKTNRWAAEEEEQILGARFSL